MTVSKQKRIELQARQNEVSTHQQYYVDMDSGKSFVVRETVQNAFREYL